MEIHRLKPLKDGFDETLFNRLFKETHNLRNSLTYQIDSRKFGVTPDIINSWFTDKFIWVFSKYHEDLEEGQLKGRIINSLKTFKYRILRKAYSKYNININQVRLDDHHDLTNIIPSKEEIGDHDLFLEMALKYLKKNLSDDAFLVLELELNPPPFILSNIKNPNTKIPANLIAEYLGIPINKDSINFIRDLRREKDYWIEEAKSHFSDILLP
jgi:hypothetical protein